MSSLNSDSTSAEESEPPPKAVIRRAGVNDIKELIAIYLEFMLDISKLDPFYMQDMEYWNEDSHEDYIKLIQKKDRRFLFLEENGKLAGFIDIVIKRRDEAYKIWKTGHIESIYVRPEYRKKGYSRILIDRAMKWFESRKMEHFTVGTYAMHKEAREYWIRLGYKEYFILYHK